MSFTNLMPNTQSHLLHAQAGRDVLTMLNSAVVGDQGGHSGSGSQDYREFLCGDATIGSSKAYTRRDNTTGTSFFPEIKYWTGLHNLSVSTSISLVELEVSASSLVGDHFVLPDVYADYDPDTSESGTSNYHHIFHGDEIFGKFNRVAVYKVSGSTYRGRLLLTRGPSSGLDKIR